MLIDEPERQAQKVYENQSTAQLVKLRTQFVREAEDVRDAAEAQGRELTDREARDAHRKLDQADQIDLILESRPKRSSGAPLNVLPAMEARSVPGNGRQWGAVARGQLFTESTYRPDKPEIRYFRDLMLAAEGGRDPEVRERLNSNNREAMDFYAGRTPEMRDMLNASTQGGDFLPPIFLSELWVEPSQALRPLADALPKYPLPDTGTSVSIPQLASGVSVAARSDGGSVSETDGVTANITHTVNEIAGLVDVGRQALMRSDPGLDVVIARTLNRRYSTYLDTQLFSGSGTAPQHVGLDNVGSIGTVTYTASTPSISGLLPLIYKAIDTIVEARAGEVMPDLIVMHSRRAGFLAYSSTTSLPVLQQGQLLQAFGTQDGGFVEQFAGLRVIIDNNITTTAGNPGTNQDKIYVLASEDFYLSEGPLYSRIDQSVGSGTGMWRIELFGNSAFYSKRYPGSGCIISGTGLATPLWA